MCEKLSKSKCVMMSCWTRDQTAMPDDLLYRQQVRLLVYYILPLVIPQIEEGKTMHSTTIARI